VGFHCLGLLISWVEWGRYPINSVPIFVGHYWLPDRLDRAPRAPDVAILDYRVAEGGCLTAYRWDGEQVLEPSRFVVVDKGWVRSSPSNCPMQRQGTTNSGLNYPSFIPSSPAACRIRESVLRTSLHPANRAVARWSPSIVRSGTTGSQA